MKLLIMWNLSISRIYAYAYLVTLSLLSAEVLNKIGNWDAFRLLLVSNKLILPSKVHLQSVI